jgi:hypothetical protein
MTAARVRAAIRAVFFKRPQRSLVGETSRANSCHSRRLSMPRLWAEPVFLLAVQRRYEDKARVHWVGPYPLPLFQSGFSALIYARDFPLDATPKDRDV